MQEAALRFSAVSSEGDALWTAERPIGCTGFVVTTDRTGRALAVLTDSRSTRDSLAATTATAYDLTTGAAVWGPVEVPGPHQGPGLVFAAPPEGYMGASGARTALDPTTGEVLAAENDAGAPQVVGEYGGVLVEVVDGALVGVEAGGGDERWSVSLAARAWPSVDASVELVPGPDLALLDVASAGTVLLDLRDGAVLGDAPAGTPLEAAVDASTRTLLLRDEEGLHRLGLGTGIGADRRPLWSTPLEPGARLESAGEGRAYLIASGNVQVVAVASGRPLTGATDPPSVAIPTLVADDGSAVLNHEGRQLLALAP